jgi:hypothetical protein
MRVGSDDGDLGLPGDLMIRISDEAVEAAAQTFAEARSQAWLTYSDETRADLVASWKPTARAALEAALPHIEGATPAIDREALVRLAERWAGMDTPGLSAPSNQEWATGVDQGYSNAAAELLALIGDAS